MTEIQEKLLEMMKWFHNLCQEENLIYYAVGGTALGAVRHNGFIPWDDDIDVAMPRKDYDKLRLLAKKYRTTKKYTIEFPLEKDDAMYPFCKIYDTTTTLVENMRKKPKRGIYIDVFPLDGIGQTLEESLNNYKKISRRINFLNTRICALRKGRKLYKNLAIVLARAIPEFVISTKKLIKKINLMEKEYDNCEYIVNLFGAWGAKEISKKEWFGEPVICKFEDGEIFIPQNAHEYLSRMYNDYMKLPPEEKRFSHHDYVFMDLKNPYVTK